MDGLVALAILVAAFPIIAIVALIMALNARDGVQRLRIRVAALEGSRPSTTVEAPAPAARPSEPATPSEVPSPAAEQPSTEPVASISPSAIPHPVPTPSAAAPTLEEKFGTRWVVWIGGLALALGGIFLVRYTVEAGLLGPGVRIFLAAIFASLLIAAGEWARRNEITTGITAIPTQHIPSTLTAAGTVAAYATVYSAFALYGFLSPAAAFLLLGIVALATLAAALLHGPALPDLALPALLSRRCSSPRRFRITGRSIYISPSSQRRASGLLVCGCGAGLPSPLLSSAHCGHSRASNIQEWMPWWHIYFTLWRASPWRLY